MTVPAIVARGVTKRFGSVTALDGATAELDQQAVGLLGANGAGKSTLMKCLLGLVEPDEGSVCLLGIDPARSPKDLRRRVGYMPEHDCLPNEMTAADVCAHFAELRGLPRREAVLRSSEVLFQVGLEEERSRHVGTYSTGMKQRAKLAQALVHAPEIVLLDEPTNGLDPAGREEMLALVRRLSHDLGVRVLVSSHVLEDIVRTCDAVCVINAGKVAAAAPLSDLTGASASGFRLRLVGPVDDFIARLESAAIIAMRVDGEVQLDCDESALDVVRDAAVASDCGILSLRPSAPTLEDALVEAMS